MKRPKTSSWARSSQDTRGVDDLREITFCYQRPPPEIETISFVLRSLDVVALLILDDSSCVQTNIGCLLFTGCWAVYYDWSKSTPPIWRTSVNLTRFESRADVIVIGLYSDAEVRCNLDHHRGGELDTDSQSISVKVINTCCICINKYYHRPSSVYRLCKHMQCNMLNFLAWV